MIVKLLHKVINIQLLKTVSTLADRLRHIMSQKGVKAANIARATGVQPGVLSRYISGKVVPSSENLLTISQYLGVTPSWLLNGSDALESPQPVYNISIKDKVIKVQDKLIDAQIRIADKDRQIAGLVKNCDALAKEVTRVEKPNEAHKELVEVIDTQKLQIEKLMAYCEGLAEEVRRLQTRSGETN